MNVCAVYEYTHKMSKYVAPFARKKQEVEVPDLTNANHFPSLSKVNEKKWDPAKNSFKETIDKMIQYEKLSEQERIARKEALTAMSGWYTISLKFTSEKLIAFNERLIQQQENESDGYVTNTNLTFDIDDNLTVISEIPDISDVESQTETENE
jgi:hypothetical protein